MPRIIVVGLGPGDPRLVTSDTMQWIQNVEHRFLRTTQHPSASLVPNAESFDSIYESAESFDDVYATIAERLLESAVRLGEILYAVPGSPLVLERTVAHLRQQSNVEIIIRPAISFLDEVWRALDIDPVETRVSLVDGHLFTTAAAGLTGPLVVAHTHANWVLSDVKLSLDDPDPTTEVVILHHLGLPDEQVIRTTWSEMDRTIEADHLTSLFIPQLRTPVAFELAQFHQLARILRDQCPWDMEQTHQSLVRYLLEEAYEVVDAISQLDENNPATDDDLIEELGDLLYRIEFHAAIAEEQGRFTMADVARSVHDKLVARHPHVFGDVVVSSSADVESNWEAIKKAEKSHRTGIFDGVVESAPSLLFAAKTQQRAAREGFDWPSIEGPLSKLDEELAEIRDAVAAGDSDEQLSEIGDLLFAVVNVARHLDIDAESALRFAVQKFRRRVEAVETLATQSGKSMKAMTLEELDLLWESVKQQQNH